MIGNIGSGGGWAAQMQPRGMQGMQPNATQLAKQLITDADADGDGSISKSEFTSLLQRTSSSTESSKADGLFSQMDSNGDGSLSSDEATTFIDNMLQQIKGQQIAGNRPPPPPGDASDLMANPDSNGDGGLSIDEFTAALEGGPGDSSQIESMFNQADSNGDGVVTQTELESVMSNPPPPPPAGATTGPGENSDLVEALFNQADSDGDGTISQKELKQMLSNHPPQPTETSASSDQVSRLVKMMLNQYSSTGSESSQDNSLTVTA